MTKIQWDKAGERLYETGVDHGVFYAQDNMGAYPMGVAWNGLTTVTESPEGAEATAQYADNIKYLNLISVEQFKGTIEAFTYPKAFELCDGTAEPVAGVKVGQQPRRPFGFAYRTLIGNDIEATAHGFKIHMIWNAIAAPSEKAHATVNDTPAADTFSWEVSTTAVAFVDYDDLAPTSTITISSLDVDADALDDLMDILYGGPGQDPRLPTPDEVVALFEAGSITDVNLGTLANQPSYNSGTHVVTLPAVTGVQWKINGVNKASGAQPALTSGQVAEVTAHPLSGYALVGDTDWVYNF